MPGKKLYSGSQQLKSKKRLDLPMALSANEPNLTLEISIVMPCLNEASTLLQCIEKAKHGLSQIKALGEIIVADNGSTDESVSIATRNGAKIALVKPKGYGEAIRGGVQIASGKYVIMGDSDDSYNFSDISLFIEKLRNGDDLVIGNRFLGGIKPKAMPWLHRYIGNPILTSFLNLLFRTPVKDAHCGLRAFRKSAFEQWRLKSKGMEFASEMVIKAKISGARISEIPVVLYPDGRNRPPHLNTFRDGLRHLILIIAIRISSLFTKQIKSKAH